MKAIARYYILYDYCVDIYRIDYNGEKVLTGMNKDYNCRRRWNKIYYTKKGIPYIKKCGKRYYLSEFIPVNMVEG